MKKIFTLFTIFSLVVLTAKSQLNIDNASFTIQAGATVAVQGDVTSNVDILGNGRLLLEGSVLQNVDMGGKTIPFLELNNAANAKLLNTDARIGESILFTNGKMQIGNLNLILGPSAVAVNAASSRYVDINGSGQLIKQLTADVAGFAMPVGENGNYRPAFLTTTATYDPNANVGLRIIGTVDAKKPIRINSWLGAYWPVTKTGVNGTANLKGQYLDPADIAAGPEANLIGYYNDGTDWSSAGHTEDAGLNQVSANVTAASGELYAMNKFILVGARAFLQGVYVAGTGLMTDNLRTLPFGPANNTANFPQDDPYRQAPYNGVFVHVNNAVVESIANAGVLDPAGTNDDIVDWVFLQVRNLAASPGNTVLATRSALLQRDGDIVEVDGVSPVTFNNVTDANGGQYILSVRHRNHLGLSIDQSSPRAIDEKQSTAYTSKVIDFRTATDAQLYGTAAAYTTAAHPGLGTANLLWGGNANFNTNTRYSALANDRDYILVTTLGNNPLTVINNIYSPADVNMNKVVRWSALNNDRDFLLITVLGNNPLNVRTQALPN